MMCVSVVDMYEDELKKGECSFGEKCEKLRRERRRGEGIRWNGVCKVK
jgi:hypothetical protein